MQCAAALVDIAAVRSVPDPDHPRSETTENARRDVDGRSVGRVQDDRPASQSLAPVASLNEEVDVRVHSLRLLQRIAALAAARDALATPERS